MKEDHSSAVAESALSPDGDRGASSVAGDEPAAPLAEASATPGGESEKPALHRDLSPHDLQGEEASDAMRWVCKAYRVPKGATEAHHFTRHNMAVAFEAGRASATPVRLERLRADGWSVAVHNDYRLAGERFTFWLLTHSDGRWIKGEGRTDDEALADAILALSCSRQPPST